MDTLGEEAPLLRCLPSCEAGQTPDGILQLGLGSWGSKTLLSAIELGMFTELGEGPLGDEILIERLGLHRRAARDFLDALVALGMLHRSGDAYGNTPATDFFLDRRKPAYVGGLLEIANARLYPFWGNLTEALRSGEPQKFPWGDYASFADLGAAQGALPVQVAIARQHLKGFDLPPVAPHFVASQGLSHRLSFQGGDFFTDPMPRADVLVMGHVVHDWDLQQKRLLIGKASDGRCLDRLRRHYLRPTAERIRPADELEHANRDAGRLRLHSSRLHRLDARSGVRPDRGGTQSVPVACVCHRPCLS